MDTPTQVQILDELVCISNCVNTLWKGMSQTLPPQAWDKIGQTELFKLGMATSRREGKL